MIEFAHHFTVEHVLDFETERECLVHHAVFERRVEGDRCWNFAILVNGHLVVIEILVHIGSIDEETSIAALANEVFAVTFDTGVAQKIRYVGDALTISGVGHG